MNGVIKTEIAVPHHLDGAVRLDVRLSSPFPDTALDELISLTRSFFRLVGLGAYVVETLAPECSMVEVLSETRSGDDMTWDIQAVAIDARVVQVFRNILVAFSKLCHPVVFLSIRVLGSAIVQAVELPPLGSKLMDRTYPPTSGHLKFAVAKRPAYSARSGRRVEIEFAEPLGDERLRRIIDRLELWSTVSLGAYASNEIELWNGECAIFDAQPDIMDDYTVAMPIEKFGAPDIAWNSLLNLCGRCRQDICDIVSVTID